MQDRSRQGSGAPRGGRLPWRKVVAPAVRLAGCSRVGERRIVHRPHARLARERDRRISGPAARPRAGTLFRQPALAATLEAIWGRGADALQRESGGNRGDQIARMPIDRGDWRARARPRRPRPRQDVEVSRPGPLSARAGRDGAARRFVGLESSAAGRTTAIAWAEIEKRACLDRNEARDPPGGRGRKKRFHDARRCAGCLDDDAEAPLPRRDRDRARDGLHDHFSVPTVRGPSSRTTR